MVSKVDREVIRRSVPKSTTNILAATVARLYVAYPDLHQWTYTGLQGAVILADDTVGHTLWIKLVDVSVGDPRTPIIPPSMELSRRPYG
jgi:neural Wiskott-Aldrich syndrome protein